MYASLTIDQASQGLFLEKSPAAGFDPGLVDEDKARLRIIMERRKLPRWFGVHGRQQEKQQVRD
ncbi:hypothetical protein ACSS6W_002495 [Trichoderma asperelloides]